MNQICYHCGDDVIGRGISIDEKIFCCSGCKTVYEILSENDLGAFYSIESAPGIKPGNFNQYKYAFLEVESLRQKFIDFQDGDSVHVTLYLPEIHCSSCIFLLENLSKINPAIRSSQVNFTARTASIVFDKNQMTFSALAMLLDKIGYAPNFGNREQIRKKKNYTLLYKLGVSGFAFGSIMLWTFPEYLGIEKDNPAFRNFTAYLSFAVSVPVLIYSANEYLISAFKALRYKSLNLDVPISIGIIALYLQSCYSIFSGLGPGYMDSFAGFIFFLLIGKWFQNKTYDSLSFERDYTSYFPVAVTRKTEKGEEIAEIEALGIGDTIIIRNEEIIPCDVELLSSGVKVDYSFVTGESNPVNRKKGDFVYAGGKLLGAATEFKVLKESNRSHLTRLWNDSSLLEKKKDVSSDKLSVYFLAGLLLTSLLSAIFWFNIDPERTTEIVVSVLIVACPCALALSRPFTYGNIMRLMGRKGLYLKNAGVAENLEKIDHIVFDKTGTLTGGSYQQVKYEGSELSDESKYALLLLVNSSTHPVSKAIFSFLKDSRQLSEFELENFEEKSSIGICGKIKGKEYKLGKASFAGAAIEKSGNETTAYLSINGIYQGRFVLRSELRAGVGDLLQLLQKNYEVHVLSGDKDKDMELLSRYISDSTHIRFEQTPKDKYNYIKELKLKGAKVLMIGDGLNDSGALDIADVGIAVSEDIFRFTPGSDAIIKAPMLGNLNYFLNRAKFARTVLNICFTFSILYNSIGLFFAISGNLTPLIAAILMPLSSITVVFLSTFIVLSKR